MAEEKSTKTLKDKTDENEGKKDEGTESIVITAGETSVKVDKEKLIQASDYFKALFEGDFDDSTKREVDISHKVNSADVLKDVDAFVSRGDITLKSTNIEDMLKLSSYFQFRSLLEKCKTYLKDTLTVETCLSYYVLSKANNLVDTEIASGRLLKARFHDYALFQESTLELSPAILADLCEDGFLKFCVSFSLLKFISQWVSRGLTKDHITTGFKILRYIDGRMLQTPLLVSVQMQSVGKVLADVKHALRRNKDVSQLLTHLELTMNNIISMAGEVNLEDNETVLLTVSGRKSAPTKSCSASNTSLPWSFRSTPAYIESLMNENGDLDARNRNLDISDEDIDTSEVQELDVCVYEPRGKIWYRLATLHRRWIKTLPLDFRFQLLNGTFAGDIVYFEDKIYLVSNGMLSFDLRTCLWSGLTTAGKSYFDCEMLQKIYNTTSRHVCDSTVNLLVLNGDLYLFNEDEGSPQKISIEMFNKETRQFENIRSIEIDIDQDETEEDESVRMKKLCSLTLGHLSRKSKRLMPLLLDKHGDLEMVFGSCVGDSQQPRVIIRDVFFSCSNEENITEDRAHYKINDIGAIETDKNILFVAVEDSTAETTETVRYTSKEGTDSTVRVTESENIVGYTTGTVGDIQSESTTEDTESATRKSESESTAVATGCSKAMVELDAETENVHVIGKYDFETSKIKFRDDISVICVHMKCERENKYNKKNRHETFGGENGFWRIKTSSDGTSCCYNVTSEEFKVTQHVPPPFSHIIAGCETELPRKLLATLEPISYMSK